MPTGTVSGLSRVLAAKKGETVEKRDERSGNLGERIPSSLYQFLGDLSSQSHVSCSGGCGMGSVIMCSAGGPLNFGF